MHVHVDTSGNSYVCLHTDDQFIVYDPYTVTFQILTNVNGYIASEFWSGDTYGDWYVFTNGYDPVQVWKMTKTGSDWDPAVDLGGSPPKARVVLTVGSYLMLLAIESDDPADLRKVQWSASGSPETWSGGDSGSLYVYEGEGNIVAAGRLTRDSIAVYKTGSFHRIAMAGFPYYFVQQTVVPSVGLWARRGVASIGEVHVVLSTSGLVTFDGSSVTPFQPMVNAVLSELYPVGKSEYAALVYERTARYLWVMIPSPGEDTGWLSRAFVFDFNSGSWTLQSEFACTTAASAAIPLSSLRWVDMNDTWADHPEWWESRSVEATDVLLLGDTSGYLQIARVGLSTRSGVPFTSVLETRMFNPGAELFQSPGTKCELVQLDVGPQADTVTIQMGTSERGDANIVWGPPLTPVGGRVYTTLVGRWFIFRVSSTTGFDITNITAWFVKRGVV